MLNESYDVDCIILLCVCMHVGIKLVPAAQQSVDVNSGFHYSDRS